MYEVIEQIIKETGLWDGRRRETHAFPISADVFTLSSEQHSVLERLGTVIRDTLASSSRLLSIALNPDLANSKAWRDLRALMQMEAPSPQDKLQALYPRKIPQIIKVDLVETVTGELKIVEIDAMNRRAMGYASLFAAIRQAIKPRTNTTPGIAQAFQQLARQHVDATFTLLYGDRERFYAPEFEILRRTLAASGIKLIVASELEADLTGQFTVRGRPVANPLFLNFPVFYQNKPLETSFVQAYQSGELSALIPPKPFLGSKALLAMLSNAGQDPELEHIVRSQIGHATLSTLRNHLPLSFVVGRDTVPFDQPFLLKEVISSGAKGIIFPSDPAFPSTLAKAKKAPGKFIGQMVEATRQRPIRFYQSPDTEVTELRNTRLVAYYFQGALSEVVVTASTDQCVHGGKNAVNMGVVIE